MASGPAARAASPRRLPAGQPPEPNKAQAAGESAAAPPPTDAVPRQNFAETAFFFPQLLTDGDGGVSFEFTVPESATSWRVYAQALSKSLQSGIAEARARTVKELLVRPYLPRFFREGDRAELRVVVNNSGAAPLETPASRMALKALEARRARQSEVLELDAYDVQARGLERGLWFDFDDPEAGPRRYRLGWVSPQRTRLLFTNRDGFEAFVRTEREVAELLRTGRLRVLDQQPIVARAIEQILGVGGVGEAGMLGNQPPDSQFGSHVSSNDMMKQNPNSVDAVSYHFYGSVSQRCLGLGIGTAIKDLALSPQWLDLTLRDFKYYAALRDKYEPGKPIWNTETAQAACGGSPWASTFLDSFRYLNQNAALAQLGLQAIQHNTLAASDYGLIDRDTMTPRPNYWAVVLWHRTMGTTVLASPKSPSPALRLYAQCMPGGHGGVTVMALNTGEAPQRLNLGGKSLGWTMTGQPVDTRSVTINGKNPGLSPSGELTGLDGAVVSGAVSLPGRSIGFYSLPGAGNAACK